MRFIEIYRYLLYHCDDSHRITATCIAHRIRNKRQNQSTIGDKLSVHWIVLPASIDRWQKQCDECNFLISFQRRLLWSAASHRIIITFRFRVKVRNEHRKPNKWFVWERKNHLNEKYRSKVTLAIVFLAIFQWRSFCSVLDVALCNVHLNK